MSNIKILGTVLLCSFVWGCSYTPFPIKGKKSDGPGLFTGKKGKFILYSSEEKETEKLESNSEETKIEKTEKEDLTKPKI